MIQGARDDVYYKARLGKSLKTFFQYRIQLDQELINQIDTNLNPGILSEADQGINVSEYPIIHDQ